MAHPQLPQAIDAEFKSGLVIPAHPLALNAQRQFNERRQRALTRYYLDAGAGGLAVAVHTTQFEIRKPEIGLLQPVLELAAEEIDAFVARTKRPIIKITGVVGPTRQAIQEAELAVRCGFHAGLLSLAALKHATNTELIDHCQAVAQIIPLVGFYLQTSVGGRRLDAEFWREFASIENVVAIKMAPFNRYYTLDVLRGVAESGRADQIALYTGNDDNIVNDLITEFPFRVGSNTVTLRIVGGLLGHWAVWTRSAVEILNKIKSARQTGVIPADILSLGVQVTDSNAAFFDVAHDFAGCIVGIHDVLRRQGLLETNVTLNPAEILTPAQSQAIDRVYAAYPHLNDDAFVAENLARWLR
jgi:dihydrodipicolinate synthase/N-acetylneuraminate lyase